MIHERVWEAPDEERPFLMGMRTCRTTRLAYADWLEEHDRHEDSVAVRNAVYSIEDLIGLTLLSVTAPESDVVEFSLEDGRRFKLYHEQDCCESVRVESIQGDLSTLVGLVISVKEEVSSDKPADVPKPEYEGPDSETWTTVTMTTEKGTVVIRWLGSSNGYYSENVNFTEVAK